MKRTRKWSYVQQEAQRLVALGLSPAEIAKRLSVNKSSVTRWLASGKLARPGQVPAPPAEAKVKPKTAVRWSTSVRKSYSLDATDQELVKMAETALAMTLDASLVPQVRLQAAGRFQSIVKQLSLVTRLSDAEGRPETPKPAAAAVQEAPRAPRTDPRRILMAVK